MESLIPTLNENRFLMFSILSPFNYSFSSMCIKALTVIGLTIYVYPEPSKRILYQCVNYVIDQYLNFKYRNYRPKSIQQSNYTFTKIQVIQLTNPINVIELPINHRLISNGCCDLNKDEITINMNQIGQLMLNINSKLILSDFSLIEIQFSYENMIYKLPIKYCKNKKIQLPLYAASDLATCLKMEYETIETKNIGEINLIEDINLYNLISQYAGPKGNFYSDTPYVIQPEYIIFDTDRQSLLLEDDDYLILNNDLGQELKFFKGHKMQM